MIEGEWDPGGAVSQVDSSGVFFLILHRYVVRTYRFKPFTGSGDEGGDFPILFFPRLENSKRTGTVFNSKFDIVGFMIYYTNHVSPTPDLHRRVNRDWSLALVRDNGWGEGKRWPTATRMQSWCQRDKEKESVVAMYVYKSCPPPTRNDPFPSRSEFHVGRSPHLSLHNFPETCNWISHHSIPLIKYILNPFFHPNALPIPPELGIADRVGGGGENLIFSPAGESR